MAEKSGMNYLFKDGRAYSIEDIQKDVRKAFAQDYVECRKKKHVTQRQLAVKTGIPQPNITRFERLQYGMKKVYLTENQLKGYIKFLTEEEYTQEKKIGPFKSPEEANAELLNLRRKRGFSEYDSRVEGNYIILQIEQDRFDDDYLGDMIVSLNRKYGQVAESRD